MMVFLNICFFVVAPELGYLVGIELFISVTQESKTNWTYNFLKILHTDFAHYHMFFTLRFKYLQILRKIYSNYVSFPSLLHGMGIIFPSVREITPMKNVYRECPNGKLKLNLPWALLLLFFSLAKKKRLDIYFN